MSSKQVAFREYKYIRETPRNRRAFLLLAWQTLFPVGAQSEMLSVADYASVINLLCSDFPFKLVRSAAKLVLIDDALECLLPLTDFFPAFQLLFFYQDFVSVCRSMFKECKAASGTASVATADFLLQLEIGRATMEQQDLFPDLAVVQSALVEPTIESADALLFLLSKSDAMHTAIGTISRKKIQEASTAA